MHCLDSSEAQHRAIWPQFCMPEQAEGTLHRHAIAPEEVDGGIRWPQLQRLLGGQLVASRARLLAVHHEALDVWPQLLTRTRLHDIGKAVMSEG